MARAPHATKAMFHGGDPTLLIVDVRVHNSTHVSEYIRGQLSLGIAILVVGWQPEDAMEFSVNDIAHYKSPIWQEVTWQGA